MSTVLVSGYTGSVVVFDNASCPWATSSAGFSDSCCRDASDRYGDIVSFRADCLGNVMRSQYWVMAKVNGSKTIR